jgi:hypothetical protein
MLVPPYPPVLQKRGHNVLKTKDPRCKNAQERAKKRLSVIENIKVVLAAKNQRKHFGRRCRRGAERGRDGFQGGMDCQLGCDHGAFLLVR